MSSVVSARGNDSWKITPWLRSTTPGALLEFVLPSTLTLKGVGMAAERKVSYAEPAAAAYAYRFSDRFSAGVEGRLRTETVNDPRYQFVDTTIVSVANESRTTSWLFDAGVTWRPSEACNVFCRGTQSGEHQERRTPGGIPEFCASHRACS